MDGGGEAVLLRHYHGRLCALLGVPDVCSVVLKIFTEQTAVQRCLLIILKDYDVCGDTALVQRGYKAQAPAFALCVI